MSLRQRKSRPSVLSALWGGRGPARKRGGRHRRRQLGPIVTRLEDRALLTVPTLTAIATSAASLTYGQTAVFTANVTPEPPGGTNLSGGTVTFMDGTTTLGTQPLSNGTAQISVPGPHAGNHEVTAIYSGNGLYGASWTPLTPSPIITTVAGGGNPIYRAALFAPLNYPDAVVADSSGDLFIADSGNYEIREVNHATGAVSIVAGNGTSGYSGDGGPATSAELSSPNGLALDGSGDLFIADGGNNVVREINLKTGIITTVAGDGTSGYSGDGGSATAAELSDPRGLAVNASGDLFIADTNNTVVREVNLKTGVITTVAGSFTSSSGGDGGLATYTQLSGPVGLALDNSGNLLVVDSYAGAVRAVNLGTGIISTVAGGDAMGDTGDGGPAATAELSTPKDVVVDGSGNLFIADSGNNAVREVYAQTGVITTIAGDGDAGYSGDGGPATAAELNFPSGLALDGSGDVFIADNDNNVVREVNLKTGIIITVAGNGTDEYSGDGGSATSAELSGPSGFAWGGSGNLYVADGNNVVREVNLGTGTITTSAGNGTEGYSGDGGPATSAELDSPSDLAVDDAGNLFIADSNNNVIREVDAKTGDISPIAGNGNAGYSGDGEPATAAELDSPSDIALDGSGHLLSPI